MTHVFMPYIAETNKYGITPLPIPVPDFWVPTALTTNMEKNGMEEAWGNTQIMRTVTEEEFGVSGRVVRESGSHHSLTAVDSDQFEYSQVCGYRSQHPMIR